FRVKLRETVKLARRHIMHRKWLLKLGAPIIALALLGACSTTENDEAPGENNRPGGKAPEENHQNNNDVDQNAPENEVNEPHEGRHPDSNINPNYDKYEGYQ
ncbi:MAG TPA: hypothetical protein VK111_09745, partial [Virgibacillus sp.]|nr:hypothetical protein [Virgibacillus sp.]